MTGDHDSHKPQELGLRYGDDALGQELVQLLIRLSAVVEPNHAQQVAEDCREGRQRCHVCPVITCSDNNLKHEAQRILYAVTKDAVKQSYPLSGTFVDKAAAATLYREYERCLSGSEWPVYEMPGSASAVAFKVDFVGTPCVPPEYEEGLGKLRERVEALERAFHDHVTPKWNECCPTGSMG